MGATHGRLVRGSGLVPFIDLGSRQLLYAYLSRLSSAWAAYERGRLSAVFTDLLNAALIFAIGRSLFDTRVVLLAAARYLVFPLVGGFRPVVHTESFATCSAVPRRIAVSGHLQDRGYCSRLASQSRVRMCARIGFGGRFRCCNFGAVRSTRGRVLAAQGNGESGH